jgi:ribosomal protein S18 acetylase RimI-like enzyme
LQVGASGPNIAVVSRAVSEAGLEVVDDPSKADLEFLDERINEFNYHVTGYRDGRYLAAFLRDAEGAIRAGLAGHTWGGCGFVSHLWVREDARRNGIGSRLLAAAEREAQRRGCARMVLSTHSFQAPAFYRRHGYREVGEAVGYPRGHSQVYLAKDLPAGSPAEPARPGTP